MFLSFAYCAGAPAAVPWSLALAVCRPRTGLALVEGFLGIDGGGAKQRCTWDAGRAEGGTGMGARGVGMRRGYCGVQLVCSWCAAGVLLVCGWPGTRILPSTPYMSHAYCLPPYMVMHGTWGDYEHRFLACAACDGHAHTFLVLAKPDPTLVCAAYSPPS